MLRTLEAVQRSPGPAAVRAALAPLPEALHQAERAGALPDWLRGVWLSGSYAVERETPLSDLDLRAEVRGGLERLSAKETWDRLDAARDLLVSLAPELEPVVHVGPWDEFPVGISLPRRRWVPSFASGQEMWARLGVREAWIARAGGHLPDAAAAMAEVRRQRARRVLGYSGPLLAFAAVSFAHGVLAALRVPPPGAPEDVPLALTEAGLVSRRDAEWVGEAYRRVLGDEEDPDWPGWRHSARGRAFVAAASRAEVACASGPQSRRDAVP